MSGKQSSMGLYQAPTDSHISSSYCNHQKTCVGLSIRPSWLVAPLSREQEMTSHKVGIFDPGCPAEQNVTCRINLASHGYGDSFQRLSKLKCQRLSDFFFHVFIKIIMIMKNTYHSIPLFSLQMNVLIPWVVPHLHLAFCCRHIQNKMKVLAAQQVKLPSRM